MAKLRRAFAKDLPAIRAAAKAWKLDDERLAAPQFLVVEDGGRMIGFGRIKPYRGFWELGTVGIEPAWRGRGLGAKIIRTLIRRFPSNRVWITTDLTEYFRRLGFRETSDGPAELKAKIADLCRVKGRAGCKVMLLRRPRNGP